MPVFNSEVRQWGGFEGNVEKLNFQGLQLFAELAGKMLI